jgi:integrase
MNKGVERTKGTIRFAFKSSNAKLEEKKSLQSIIFLFFSYGKNRFKYSTGYKASFNDWDFKKQRIKNKVGIEDKDKINEVLSDLESYLNKEYSNLINDSKNVSNELLKYKLDVFLGKIIPNQEIDTNLSFFDVIDKYIDEKEGNISIITIRSYKQTKKRLEAYEKHYNRKLMFDYINISFYKDFNSFMESENYALNTIGKHIKNFKTFLNYALAEGYTNNQKFKSKDFKVLTEITTEIYLTDSEIKLMFEKDLSKFPEVELARDIFLMGCYTGQRISDYNGLSENDIVEIDGFKYFKIKQKKNKKFHKEVLCPITKEMKKIMSKRHNNKPPRKIAESYLNDYIKQVGQMLKWNELVKCTYTKGGKEETKMIPKYDLIKSHTARRSFCTNKYKAGMNIFDIMLFSGHSTEKEFYKYIRIKDQERASHIVKSGFFNV